MSKLFLYKQYIIDLYVFIDDLLPKPKKHNIGRKLSMTPSEIEGIWGVLRTFIRRMYHHVTFKKLPKVVVEFEARKSQQKIFENPLNFLKNALSLSI